MVATQQKQGFRPTDPGNEPYPGGTGYPCRLEVSQTESRPCNFQTRPPEHRAAERSEAWAVRAPKKGRTAPKRSASLPSMKLRRRVLVPLGLGMILLVGCL